MRRCPFCEAELSESDRNAAKCPSCRKHLPSIDAHAETVASPRPDTGVTIEDVEAVWRDTLSGTEAPGTTIKPVVSPAATPSKMVVKPRAVSELRAEARTVSGEASADYEIADVIGEGGMGIVYEARQTSIDRTIALKMLKPLAAGSEEQQARFLAEAAVTGDLDHPNIVPIHDLGSDDKGRLFYTMKRVQGTPWSERIGEKPLDGNIEILMRIGDAVAFAHSRGVIHRDLKPENIMLGDFGEVLLMDWGLASASGAGGASQGKAATLNAQTPVGGTPAYMAPEMAQGRAEEAGARSDVYLLGAILYEIITGSPPHAGETTLRCLYHAAVNEIEPTEEKGELVNIALKAMATEPGDRYASVKDLQSAIRAYRTHGESIGLASRAEEELKKAEQTGGYDHYAQARFGFREALKMWSGNEAARRGLTRADLEYAACAYENDDLDLAASLLESGDPAYTELARKVKAARLHRTTLTRGWGRESNKAIADCYTREGADQLSDPRLLLKAGFALYDFERYAEALVPFERICEIRANPMYTSVSLIWQGHILDLLGEREAAVARYKKAAGMNVTGGTMQHSQYGMKYVPSEYAAERIRSPFVRVENCDAD